MLNWIRKAGTLVAGCVATGVLLTGCGGGGGSQPTKSAASDIKAAKSALEEGQYALAQNRFDEAKGHFETARSKIVSGKVVASMVEKGKLDELSSEVNDALATIDIKQKDFQNKEKLRKEKEEREKQIAELTKKTGEAKTGPTAEDKAKAEAKKKEEEEKLKKEQEEARLKAMSAATKKDNSKTAEEEAEAHAEAKTVAGKTVEGEGEEKAAPKGPYKAYGENPPNISVDAVNAKGEYMFCYVQLFNKTDTDKRIGKVDGTFKDAGNGLVDEAIGCYQFDFFARDIADPTEQNNAKAALTGGSHTIPAHGSIMLVLVGKHRNAAKAKKCAVTANFEDGSSFSETGPGSVLQEAEKPAIPGLK
ncbi:MAG: hypothetical protein KIS92_06310 [Planctomycetota bacterium]|nr:hypothetical protein [Planctomycetota bacterium]